MLSIQIYYIAPIVLLFILVRIGSYKGLTIPKIFIVSHFAV